MSAHAKKFCECGHSMAVHDRPIEGGPCRVCGPNCTGYTVLGPISREAMRSSALSATSHLRLSIGALRDVETGDDEETGTSAAYWRQKLEGIADLLESDLKDLK